MVVQGMSVFSRFSSAGRCVPFTHDFVTAHYRVSRLLVGQISFKRHAFDKADDRAAGGNNVIEEIR